MDKYRHLVQLELKESRSRIPKSGGTIDGMLHKVQALDQELKILATRLTELGNRYIDNDLSSDQVEDIKEINKSAISELAGEF